MSLPASRTVAEVRADAMALTAVGRSGNSRKNIKDLATQYLVMNHRIMYLEHEWTRQRIVVEVALVTDQSIYNTPDETLPGEFDLVWIEDDEGRTAELQSEIRPNERDSASYLSSRDPRLWWHQDGHLHVAPAPSDRWTKLKIQCKAREGSVREDTDLVQVDPVLLAAMVAYDLKREFEEEDPGLKEKLDRLGLLTEASESDGGGFQLGGHQSAIVRAAAQKRNRIAQRDQPYFEQDGFVYGPY